jgi:isoleucyl-tRNA synthetase
MAPILSFTAEEIWSLLSGNQDDSVMVHAFHALPVIEGEAKLVDDWSRIRAVRAEAMKVIEDRRGEGTVGSSLRAEVEVHAAGETHDLLAALGDDLRFVLISSKAVLVRAASDNETTVVAVPSAHAKCARCWHYRGDVGADAAHPELCGRCVSNLHGAGEPRTHA